MTEKEIHRQAVRLCEGGTVCINGLYVRALSVPDDINACNICEMDSACNMDMTNICAECDGLKHKKHYLKLVTKN